MMNVLWLTAFVGLWVLVLSLGFLLLGVLRSLALLGWRLEQLEATTPQRVGRGGLKTGSQAPDFTLPSTSGGEVALHDFAGRKVLLVFTQTGCSPCRHIVPELNRLERDGGLRVVVVSHGPAEECRKWAGEVGARFPVLVQEDRKVSRSFQVFATPFAFVLDDRGVVRSKGFIRNGRHIGFVLSGASDGRGEGEQPEAEPSGVEMGNSRGETAREFAEPGGGK